MHLFLSMKYELKVIVPNKIKNIKIIFSEVEALIFLII